MYENVNIELLRERLKSMGPESRGVVMNTIRKILAEVEIVPLPIINISFAGKGDPFQPSLDSADKRLFASRQNQSLHLLREAGFIKSFRGDSYARTIRIDLYPARIAKLREIEKGGVMSERSHGEPTFVYDKDLKKLHAPGRSISYSPAEQAYREREILDTVVLGEEYTMPKDPDKLRKVKNRANKMNVEMRASFQSIELITDIDLLVIEGGKIRMHHIILDNLERR